MLMGSSVSSAQTQKTPAARLAQIVVRSRELGFCIVPAVPFAICRPTLSGEASGTMPCVFFHNAIVSACVADQKAR
jgi:hypothetical protein